MTRFAGAKVSEPGQLETTFAMLDSQTNRGKIKSGLSAPANLLRSGLGLNVLLISGVVWLNYYDAGPNAGTAELGICGTFLTSPQDRAGCRQVYLSVTGSLLLGDRFVVSTKVFFPHADKSLGEQAFPSLNGAAYASCVERIES